jgi:ATP-dependent DNA helicase RecG
VALREALINALIHRDYTNGGRDIKVAIYDDILSVVSPGGLPNTITAQDIQNGRSEARNKLVATVFKELGLIEQWGSGISRIKSVCKANGLDEPSIEERNDFVDVRFYRSKSVNNNGTIANDCERLRTIANDCERLSKEEQKILLYLLDNENISRKEASGIVGQKSTKTFEILSGLVEKSLIVRYGNGRSTHYKLAKADEIKRPI